MEAAGALADSCCAGSRLRLDTNGSDGESFWQWALDRDRTHGRHVDSYLAQLSRFTHQLCFDLDKKTAPEIGNGVHVAASRIVRTGGMPRQVAPVFR